MRHRRWVVVLAILIIAVLPLAFLGLKIASRHPAVKRVVLSRIMPEVGADLTIGELELGLASLHVTDVMIDFGEDGYVFVPSATANLSLPKLVAAGLMPERSLSTIIVSDPEIVIIFGHERAAPDPEESDGFGSARFDVSSLEGFIPDYLGVSGAALSFRDSRTGRTLTVDSIDLLMEREMDGPVTGGASADCLGGEGNLEARFTWDGDRKELSVEGALTEADLGGGLPIPPTVAAEVRSGVMSGAFYASASPDSVHGIEISFDVSDGDVALTAFDEILEDVNASGRFEGGIVSLDDASGLWRGSRWSASGEVASEGGELRGVRLDAAGVPVAPVVELFEMGDLETGGSVNITARVEGSLDYPAVDVAVSSGEIRAGGLSLSEMSGSARLTRDSIDVAEVKAGLFGGTASASGSMGRSAEDELWWFDVAGDASGLDVARLVEAATGDTTARGSLSLTGLTGTGTLERPRLESLLMWENVLLGPLNPGSGAGGFMLSDGDLSVSLGAGDRSYSATCHVDELFGAREVSAEIVLTGLRVDSLVPALSGRIPPTTLSGSLGAGGPADSLVVGGDALLVSGPVEAAIDLAGTLTPTGEGTGGGLSLSLSSSGASVRGVPTPFTAELAVDSDQLRLSDLRIADYAELSASVGLRGDGELSAGMVISEADLRDVLAVVAGAVPVDADGLVFASVSAGGTVAEPVVGAQVSVGTAGVAGVRGLDAHAVASLEDGVVTLDEFELREYGRIVATAHGMAELGGAVELLLVCDGVPGPMLGGAAGTRFDATAGIGGTTDAPTLDGRVTSSNGEFLGIPFDDYSARVSAGDGMLSIDPLVLERDDQYRATASVSAPYGEADLDSEFPEGTLTLEVDGNPLAFLAEFTDAAETGPGAGTLSAVLAGGPDGVTVASARLEARAQRVVPAGLFERIDDVSVGVEIRDGAVVSAEVEGRVDGSEMRIESQRGRVVAGRELPSLIAGGVDLGVIALSTDGRGVTANVPGLMLPDEYGRVVLRGKAGEPEFLIAGPPERPLLWGEIEFSDLSFTYPFVGSGGEGFGDLMSGAEWSLRMMAGRNLWYWRPDANLNVERGGGLDFIGVPSEHTMCVSGRVTSTKGTLIYLHTEFNVREVSIDFPAFCEQPRFEVDAETRVADGTVIGLSMSTSDGVPALATGGVTLDESTLVLTSDSADDNTPEKIMSKLQYGVSYDLLEADEQAAMERRRAVEFLGTQIGLRVARPLLAPIESRIRRNLNLDLVRIDVDFVEHFLMQLDLWAASEGTSPYVPFTANTRMTLGKYLARDWLLSYQGVVEQYEQDIGESMLGMRSELGIEYEVSRNTSLSLKVVYDPTLAGWDRRISIENRYEF